MRYSKAFVAAATLLCVIPTFGCDSSNAARTTGAGGAGNAGGGGNGGSSSTAVRPAAIDLLFMVDNSASMADKQSILAAAVPRLLGRLTQPNCVDSSGAVVGQSQLGATPQCSQGTLELEPINDIHIGVVTSSLGDHGANSVCTPGAQTYYTDANGQPMLMPDDVNDEGHLIGTLTRGNAAIQSDTTFAQSTNVKFDAEGFLAWGDPSAAQAPTPSELGSAQSAFSDMVRAASERGCGFEAQLESWFRFLIDPVPPILPLAPPDSTSQTHRTGVDDALLAQRAAFLRPNSLLGIVMMTDENDCSVRDSGVGWISANVKNSIPASSPACATNPNDKCCYSCSTTPPAGCAACPSTSATAADDGPYQVNVRCWHQKRRFGVELLYPTSRYVVGLTHPELCPDQTFGDMDCDCTYANSIGASCSPGTRRMPNPLYSDIIGQNNAGNAVPSNSQVAPRTDNSNIFLAGIVGVPWQDIGYVDANGNLKYIPVTDPVWSGASSGSNPVTPATGGIWSMIYGDDSSNVVPGDVHMIESLEPRPGLPGPTAAATADPIVGHDYNTAYEDLQYACVFTLATPRPCQCTPGSTDFAGCKYLHPNECCDLSYSQDGRMGPGADFDKPVCQSNTQVAAKAYPGLREIAVLRDYALGKYATRAVAGNSIVTSVCPKDLATDSASAGYGYNPAVDAIVDRLKQTLSSN